MITQEQQKYKKVLSIIAGAMLLLAIPSIWPYGFFQILRWIVTGTAVYNGYIAHKTHSGFWLWTMIIIAILFNPIIPIHLVKETWIVIDLLTALLFITSIWKIK